MERKGASTVVTVGIFIALSLVALLVLGSMGKESDVSGGGDSLQEGEAFSGVQEFSLIHEGIIREYFVYVPQSYLGEEVPLIISLHGGYGNGAAARRGDELDVLSEREGFLVAYPSAVVGPQEPTTGNNYSHWNAGPRVDPHKAPEVDDVGFLSVMIDQVAKDYAVNTSRVYVTGISNGGMMAYRVACQLSDKVVAVAPIAGNQLSGISCSPEHPISLIHFHGTGDKAVPYYGGESSQTKDEWVSVEETISFWVERNNCAVSPETTYSEGDAICVTYSGCDDSTEVVLCTIEGGGHTWPGGTHNGAVSCQDNPGGLVCRIYKNTVGEISRDISANEQMWLFFQRHSLVR